jgi:alkylation response protein AidB-like acyl-CoA dehydrogenase
MSRIVLSEEFRELCDRLRCQPAPEGLQCWPVQQLQWLGQAGGWRWNMPIECGGLGCSAIELLEIYRDLSAACLTTAFVLTQRNAACQRLVQAERPLVSRSLLRDLASGQLQATVGISHLTTSRQYLSRPAVVAEPAAGGWSLSGVVPWATGAASSQLLVTGAVTADGLQLLVQLPLQQAGVTVGLPVELLGLSAAWTSEVHFEGVFVPQSAVLAGPGERVLSGGSAAVPAAGSLSTSAVALGFGLGALAGFREEAELRSELRPFVQRFEVESEQLWQQLQVSAGVVGPGAVVSSCEGAPLTAEQVRTRSNSFALRTAQAWLAATRGAGYRSAHRASRAVRESLFFLVWSCPQAVLESQLQELTVDWSDEERRWRERGI